MKCRRNVNYFDIGHARWSKSITKTQLSTCYKTNELPEDGLQLRPKHVGALINKQKTFCNKLALNLVYYKLQYSSPKPTSLHIDFVGSTDKTQRYRLGKRHNFHTTQT